MSTTLETLQAEVWRLSPKDRARLLDRLIASLDADADADDEAVWDAVADKREAEMDAGTLEAVPLDAALSRLEARFPGSELRSIRALRRTSRKPPGSTNEKELRYLPRDSSPSSENSLSSSTSIQVSALLVQGADGASR